MARPRTTRFAVLGMLAERPMTGYDLREAIAASIGHFWHESFGQLYPALRELEAEGLVEALAPDGRRIPYRITDAGRAALREWLGTPPARIEPTRDELLLRLTFGRHAAAGAIRGHLEHHAAQLRATRERYRELEARVAAETAPDRPYWLASIRAGVSAVDAALAWTAQTLADLPEEP